MLSSPVALYIPRSIVISHLCQTISNADKKRVWTV